MTCKEVVAADALMARLAGKRPKGDIGCWKRFKN
jgi:hypothetical protein